jgi:hypothetical protein
MFVPSYQMHNVLNVYSRQLRQNIASSNNKKTAGRQPADQVSLTTGGKREATIEKVSKDIVNKITKFGSLNKTRYRVTESAKDKAEIETAAGNENKTTFVFNVIDDINKKITNTLSVEDPGFLIRQFEQISKDAEEKKTESWV